MRSVIETRVEPRSTTTNRARFCVGSTVAVRVGIPDPDFPDLGLDGWTGTIVDVDRKTSPPRYLLHGSREVVHKLPRRCRERCKREDRVLDKIWLYEEDLEAVPS